MATFTATANVVTWTSTEDPRVVFRFVSADGESSGDGISQAQGDARYLQQSNDLSDVDDAAAARTNLGLGSAATADSDDFDVAPSLLVDAVEGASNPWDLDGLVGNGAVILLTTVTTVTLPDAADLPAGSKVRFTNGSAGALSLTINCAGSDEFPSSATSINPTIPIGGTVVVTKFDTGIGFEWGWGYLGNTSGPASATDSAIALFDGTTGKTLKDSAVTISTDEDLTSDSDSKVPTEQAVKAYVDANAGGGGGLWQQHSETTLGSAAASVALSFPATYQSIRIVAQLQSTHSAKVNVYGRVNADSGSNYQNCAPVPNSGYVAWATAGTVLNFGEIGATSSTDGSELVIEHENRLAGKYPLFRSAMHMTWLYVDRQEIDMTWNRWLNTADAISTLTLMAQTQYLEAGSYFRVEYIA